MKDEFHQSRFQPTYAGTIAACPCCSGKASLWACEMDDTGERREVVCCETADIGLSDGVEVMCLMYLPPFRFYNERAKNAVDTWNAFAARLIELRSTDGPQTVA